MFFSSDEIVLIEALPSDQEVVNAAQCAPDEVVAFSFRVIRASPATSCVSNLIVNTLEST